MFRQKKMKRQKKEFLKIKTYEEFAKRGKKFDNLPWDKETKNHVITLFGDAKFQREPVTDTVIKEELFFRTKGQDKWKIVFVCPEDFSEPWKLYEMRLVYELRNREKIAALFLKIKIDLLRFPRWIIWKLVRLVNRKYPVEKNPFINIGFRFDERIDELKYKRDKIVKWGNRDICW